MSAAQTFHYKCYKNTFTNMTDVMHHMQDVQHELQGTDQVNALYFNLTYFIITKNVNAQNEKNYFTYKEDMTNLDITFARYYFDALQSYAQKKNTTPAWQIAFDCYKENKSNPLIYLALGVNAHVNNDLTFALKDIVNRDNYRNDYEKVNTVITESLDEVIAYIKAPVFYKPFMNAFIRRWRENAWRNFLALQKQEKTNKDIENYAEEIAKKLTQIKSKYDYHRLLRVI